MSASTTTSSSRAIICLTRHDKWLCMIWPRLKLLRELLRDDGAIFISIDDNKAHRLRMVMDEIFGEHSVQFQVVHEDEWERVLNAMIQPDSHRNH